jgi:hypothetical protein
MNTRLNKTKFNNGYREPKPNTNHVLAQYKVNDPDLVTNQQLLQEAKSLVAKAMQSGLISKK